MTALSRTRSKRQFDGSGTHQRVGALGRVLGIWAHPDDETYLAGGLLAAAADNGQATGCITATAGEHGTTDPLRWPPSRLAARRRRELHTALIRLGVEHHAWLDYEDGRCAAMDHDRAVQRVLTVLDRFRPDTIVTFGPDGITGHPDHIAVGAWATAAADAYGDADVLFAAKTDDWQEDNDDLHRRSTVFEPGYPWTVAARDTVVDLVLDDPLLRRKVHALHAQHSQTAPLIALWGRRRWREWVRQESFVDARSPRQAIRGELVTAT